MGSIKNITDFPVGTRIEMTVNDPVDGKLEIGFVSQIESYTDVDVIRILAPIYEAKVYPVRVNSRIEAFLFYKSTQLYRIAGYVTNRLIINDIALLDIRVTENIQRTQRRQFFRFKCHAPVVLFGGAEEDASELVDPITGSSEDISGGGISVVTDAALSIYSEIRGRITLDSRQVDFKGRVLRSHREIINSSLKYLSSISFVDIGFKEREVIVRYIFNQQRILLNKWLRGNG